MRQIQCDYLTVKYLIGVDEVGRGPIAGPVAVGAFIFLKDKARRLFNGVKESKQLSEKQREKWFKVIQESKKAGHIDFAVSFQSEKIVDSKGISWAIRQSLETSLKKLRTSLGYNQNETRVMLDGGLKAPVGYLDQKTIIKGDQKIIIIALASICAKVLRDRRMIMLGRKHPEYGFEKHKGYGTRRHYEAIREYGMLEIHRKSFLTALSQ